MAHSRRDWCKAAARAGLGPRGGGGPVCDFATLPRHCRQARSGSAVLAPMPAAQYAFFAYGLVVSGCLDVLLTGSETVGPSERMVPHGGVCSSTSRALTRLVPGSLPPGLCAAQTFMYVSHYAREAASRPPWRPHPASPCPRLEAGTTPVLGELCSQLCCRKSV